jgi:hypothetical protein
MHYYRFKHAIYPYLNVNYLLQNCFESVCYSLKKIWIECIETRLLKLLNLSKIVFSLTRNPACLINCVWPVFDKPNHSICEVAKANDCIQTRPSVRDQVTPLQVDFLPIHPFTHIDPLHRLKAFYQLVFAVNKIVAVVIGRCNFFGEEYGLFWTSFFA